MHNLDTNIFLFLDVPTLKLKIILILPPEQPKIILPTARTTKSWVSFAVWWLFSMALIQYNVHFTFFISMHVFDKQDADFYWMKKLAMYTAGAILLSSCNKEYATISKVIDQWNFYSSYSVYNI